MFCPNCGTQLEEGSIFCPNCGERVAEIAQDPGNGTGYNDNSFYPYDNVSPTVYGPPPVPEDYPPAGPSSRKNQKKKIPPIIIILLIILTAALIVMLLMLILGRDKKPLGGAQNGSGHAVDSTQENDASTAESSTGANSEASQAAESAESTAESMAEETPTPTPTETPTPEPTPFNPTASYSSVAPTQYTLDQMHQAYVQSAVASSELVQSDPTINNSPIRAFDHDTITSWQDGNTRSNGEGEYLSAHLSGQVSVTCIELNLGNWREPGRYTQNNRPRMMTVELGGYSFDIEFPDTMTPHYIVFSDPIPNVQDITFRVVSVYPAETGDCCISEVTFYTS